MTQAAYQIKPIGTVQAQAGVFQVVIDAPYRPALKGLSEFSHVMIFWWAHETDEAARTAVLQVDLPYAPGTVAGIFATRSPLRPNPIALTTMPMLDVDEAAGIVTLPWIDALDGTPVLDLKPYMPMADRIRDVHAASWLADWPLWMEDAAAFLAENEIDFGD